MFELNKVYNDGYDTKMLVIYINLNPQIRYPVVAINLQTNTIRTYTHDGLYCLSEPTSRSNLIPPTAYPQPGEVWTETGYPNNLYRIFKSPETGSLMAINTKYFELFVLDSDDTRRSRSGGLILGTRHVQ